MRSPLHLQASAPPRSGFLSPTRTDSGPPALRPAHNLCNQGRQAAPGPRRFSTGVGHTSCSPGGTGGTFASPGGMG